MTHEPVLPALLDSLDLPVLGCDAAEIPVLFNSAARAVFGSLLDGVPVSDWLRHVDARTPDGRPLDAGDLALARALRGEAVRDAEVSVLTGSGARRSFRIHASPVPGPGPVAAVLALHDVTVERTAARLNDCELRLSRLLSRPGPADTALKDAVELIGAGLAWPAVEFWSVDPVGAVLRRQYVWDADDDGPADPVPDTLVENEGVAGRAWHTAEPEWSADLVTDRACRADRGGVGSVLAVPIPSGTATLGVLACFSADATPPGPLVTAVLTGIAAHLGEFLERRRVERVAAELEQTRNEYISLVGHELRTPLTSIQSLVDIMRTEPDLEAAERDQFLTVMHRNTGQLQDLVGKLLDVAAARTGHAPPRPETVDLAEIVHDVATQAGAHGGPAIDVNVDGHPTVDADPQRLRRVLEELVSNALTWAPHDSTVGINVATDRFTTEIAVSNTGPRIADRDRDRVFGLLFRTETAAGKALPGRGLGLTYARAVVEQHGGTLTLSEPEEAATTFTVRLPTRRPADTEA